MQITGGRVTFGRSVQPAQYETKKAEVEITFSFAEGENLEGKLDLAASIAQDKALEMVGLKKGPANVAGGVMSMAPGTYPGKEVEGTPLPPKAKTKADLEADKINELAKATERKEEPKKTPKTPPKTEKPQISTGDERKDPAQEADPFSVLAEKPVEEDPFSVPAADITDDKLLSELQAANGVLKDPVTLRGLITKYVGKTPCKAVDIPQGARAQFIADLTAAVAAKKAILK